MDKLKKLIIDDEYAMTAHVITKCVKAYHRGKVSKAYDELYFLSDSSFLCDYLYVALKKVVQKFPAYSRVDYCLNGKESDYRRNTLALCEATGIPEADLTTVSGKTDGVFFFADCVEGFSERDTTLHSLENTLHFLKNNPSSKCIVTVLLPEIPDFDGELMALSEREYNYYIEKEIPRTPEIEYYLTLEKMCRDAVRDNGSDIVLLRLDNCFAPDRYHTPSLDIPGIIQEAYQSKKLTVSTEDCIRETSLTYVRDACYSVFSSLQKCVKGNVYNVAMKVATAADIKEQIYSAYTDVFAFSKNVEAGVKKKYNQLSQLKFTKRGIKSCSRLVTGLKHSVSYLTEEEYDTSDNIAFYNGKIKTIQQLEIEILKEIDKICVENDIKYFLAGGTLLGCVRSGGAIPWDDDLDIGMLRPDYEKFRKICEEKLPESFMYSSPFNDSHSHYTLDKVRLKGTYFSTNYSSKNMVEDGVFVDILVYDQTSNHVLGQKFQTLMLAILYDCIIVRWYNVPRKNFHYRLTKLLLPILRIFPWGFYHHLFEFFVKLYQNKKDAAWLIDSVGKKLKDGPLPKKGLEDTVYVDFEDIKAPIPVDYTGYLNYAYGPNYMQKPNLSMRSCPHNFARIDLGKYLFDCKGQTPFRDVDLRGELFESENEK